MKDEGGRREDGEGMIVAIDIGNTTIALGLFEGNRLLETWRIGSERKKTGDEYALLIRGLFAMGGFDGAAVKGAIIGSVVPPLNAVLQKCGERLWGFPPLLMTHETPIGMENRYGNPQEVGMDRLANAVGGKRRTGAPVIIVDFGTAVTLDLVDRDGAYAGGCILPGLETSAEALSRCTAQLPRIPLQKPSRVLGKTTIVSIQAGLYFGITSAVDGLIDRLWDEIGYKTAVIVTGGGADSLNWDLAHEHIYDPHLTLLGLKAIWELNNRTEE